MLCNIFLPGRVNTTVTQVVAYTNAFRVRSSFTLLYRNATMYFIILPCLKLKNFNLPNHVYYCIVLTLSLSVTRVKLHEF